MLKILLDMLMKKVSLRKQRETGLHRNAVYQYFSEVCFVYTNIVRQHKTNYRNKRMI